jgi:Spy/CpxP family protein refolding chaperone
MLACRVVTLKGVETRRRCGPVQRVQAANGALCRPSPKEAVMKTLIAIVGLVVGVLAYAAQPAVAEDKADQRKGPAESTQDLHLTDEQEAKIADIRKEYKPKVQEATKELTSLVKDEVDKIRGVLTDEQKKKLESSKEERQKARADHLAETLAHVEELDLTDAEKAKIAEIRKEFKPKIAKAMEGLNGILTEEQKKTREEGLKAGKTRKEILAALNLTDEQKQKVEAVGKEVRDLVHDHLEKVHGVLTEGQNKKLGEIKDEVREHVRDAKAHVIANLKELNLSDEQKTRIADIRNECRSKIHEAGNKVRGTVREEMGAIMGVLKR